MPSKISLYVRYLRPVNQILDWILFCGLLISALLFAPFSIYAFLALLSMALFMLPVGWFRYEFKLRFTLFLSTVAFLILLFIVSKVPPVYIVYEIVLASFSVILLVRRSRWTISEYIGTKDVLYFAAFLMILVTLFLISRQQPEYLILISGLITTILMLNYLCTALRRSELSRISLEIGGFKTPEEFIEKLVEKADVKDAERRDFIRYRFREFLGYVERGEFKQAYVTFATGILEQIIIEQLDTGKSSIWDRIKSSRLGDWRIHHGESGGKGEAVSYSGIRAAIVHSTPKPTDEHEKKKCEDREEEMRRDLEKKKAILNKFRTDPITPIDYLLRTTADILGIGKSRIKTKKRKLKIPLKLHSTPPYAAQHTKECFKWLDSSLH